MAKIRTGFVSNSSSSSFIVIGESNISIPNYKDQEIVVDKRYGETIFGWKPERFCDFQTKLNFAFIQAMYLDEMVEGNYNQNKIINLLMAETGCSTVINNLSTKDTDVYVDHSSAAYEGKNIEIFDDVYKLYDFLFSTDSCIVIDNDNY